jgi:hypothetical protein
VHAGPLRALTDLAGVAGTKDGIRIAPRFPTETFHVEWPRLELEWAPNLARGVVVPVAAGTIVMEVALPSALASEPVVAMVNGVEVPVTVTSGVARFEVAGVADVGAEWSIAVE